MSEQFGQRQGSARMSETDSRESIDAQAAAWFARVRGSSHAQFEAEGLTTWLAEPEHAAAYARIERLWAATGELADDADIRQITAAAMQPRKGKVSQPGSNMAWWAPSLGATAIIVLAIALRSLWLPSQPDVTFAHVYRSGHEVSQSVTLPDGSTLQLNVDSQARVAYERGQRSLVLESGEAVFTVYHDSLRPFIVRAGNTVVRATGTRFSVRMYDDRIGVALVEGSVDVSTSGSVTPVHAVLSPGQYVEVTQRGDAVRRTINPGVILAWTEGKLVFESVPLSAAIDEFNRYTPQKIQFDVSNAGDIPITGVFDIDDPASFVAALNAMLPHTRRESEGTRRLRDP